MKHRRDLQKQERKQRYGSRRPTDDTQKSELL